MGKLFIWDFHGVLEKDNEHAVVEVTNQVLEEFGAEKRLDLDLCLKLYGKRWFEYYQLLHPKADEQTIKAMVDRGVEISRTTDVIYRHIKPMDYVHDVLRKIKQAGHDNLIVSNTQPHALDMYLDAVKITHFITHRIGADSHRKGITGNIKISLLKEFLKSRKYDKIIAIGDRETDIELGKSVGAVNYLFSRTNNFPQTNAHFKISDLREVLKEL
ncbi:HAD hydrolase-like protein [Candidatus Woesearchaeota archaeon]|nr:HAD hydrolase-like protein [Candidatus Woesearchaeota archaeon]